MYGVCEGLTLLYCIHRTYAFFSFAQVLFTKNRVLNRVLTCTTENQVLDHQELSTEPSTDVFAQVLFTENRVLNRVLNCTTENRVLNHQELSTESSTDLFVQVLFTENRVLKLADFGLAIDQNEERAVTRAGTLDYMVRFSLIFGKDMGRLLVNICSSHRSERGVGCDTSWDLGLHGLFTLNSDGKNGKLLIKYVVEPSI